MFRFRRYRVFLICAFIIVVLLLQVSRNSDWEPRVSSTLHDHTHPHYPQADANGRGTGYEGYAKPKAPDYSTDDEGDTLANPRPKEQQTIRLPQLKTSHEAKGEYSLPTPTTAPVPSKVKALGAGSTDSGDRLGQTTVAAVPSIPDRKPGQVEGIHDQQHGDIHIQKPPGAYEGPVLAATTTIHWHKVPEHFPVPEESLIMLPTGKPKPMPPIQHRFGEESEATKAKRESRLAKVKAEAQRAWSGYKEYAWTHDEVKPVTKQFRDPFCGWAATLVDSLDTLWIMGMKDEFEDAAKAVGNIDFTTTPYRSDIPVFETTIRYLGGLLAAYDVSGGHSGKYKVLLDKAVELAEILMGVFDTPNRMPVLYYNWKPAFASQPHRASPSASVAELGSLSMEFTRLAQLTGKNKYYDAVARITNAFEEWQNRGTALPGIFPQIVDASGCNRTAAALNRLAATSSAAKAQAEISEDLSDPPGYRSDQGSADGEQPSMKQQEGKKDLEFQVTPGGHRGDPGTGEFHSIGKREVSSTSGEVTGTSTDATSDVPGPHPLTAKGLPDEWDCVPQGLVSGGYGSDSYSMGGSQDSTYEYFPKQYLLLGGLEPKYRALYENTVKAVKKYLLYRPMTKDDRDILFSAKAYSSSDSDRGLTFDYEVTHLTCFLGGMFGLGGKLFDSPEDVEVGKRLADGCVWAYEMMPTGIMPEMATVLACEKATDCHWNETLWWDLLDPNSAWRDEQMEDYRRKKKIYEQELEQFNQETARRKKVEKEARREEALREQAEEGKRSLRLKNETLPGRHSAEALRRRQVAYGAEGELLESSNSVTPKQTGEKTRNLAADLDLNNANGHRQQTYEGDREQTSLPVLQKPIEPTRPVSHEEYVADRIKQEHLPPGFVSLNDRRYILRPEAIESVWYMYRITGDPSWQEKGWRMFESIVAATQTPIGHSAIDDVAFGGQPSWTDNMESFWLAETLKYFYLLFTPPDYFSLDEWVLNTEAHPFKLSSPVQPVTKDERYHS
ncbi:hypothetical protein VTK73DRAFT_6803 [Phialemonium thermophilum]|uniref:alpha-1,2-Mannosidase n=1 Tax=Phialemonium thermophilum TaxID=223376 RepID=A0ABR3Y8X7_9PEZI